MLRHAGLPPLPGGRKQPSLPWARVPAFMAALGASLFNVVLALGIVYTPRVARVVRAATLVVRERQFVEAAIANAASDEKWTSIEPGETA